MKALVISFFERDAEPWIAAGWDVEWCDAVVDAKDRLIGVDVLVCPKMKLLKLMESVDEDLVPNVWCDVDVNPETFRVMTLDIQDDIVTWKPTMDDPYPHGDPKHWPEVAEFFLKDLEVTNLWRRKVFLHWLDVERKNNETGPYYLAFLDANDLKKANDENGHEMGDKLLRDIGQAIEETLVDEHSLTVRWAGDEYVAMWKPGMTDKEFRSKFDQQCRQKQVSASVGVVKVENLAQGVDKEVKDADLLMQADKKKRKAGREYANQLSFRQRIMGVKPQGPVIQERREINSPILWVWSQDERLLDTGTNVALAVSWGLAEQLSLPTVYAAPDTDLQRKKLRVPNFMFENAENGRLWTDDNERWQAFLTSALSSETLRSIHKLLGSIVVVDGGNTPPPSDTADINIVRDRIDHNITVVTPLGKDPLLNSIYPVYLGGRPNNEWVSWATNVIEGMGPGLHRYL